MRRFAGVCTLLLGGCQLVFPLGDEGESTTFSPVEVTLVSSHVENNSSGMPRFGVDSTTAFAIVTFDDRSSIEIGADPTGVFSFERPTRGYQLQLNRDGDVFEIQDSIEKLAISYDTVGRTTVTPTAPGTFIQAPARTAGTAFAMLATTGQWANPEIGELLDWSAVEGIGNLDLGLLNSAVGDELYYVEFEDDRFAAGQTVISNFLVERDVAMLPNAKHVMEGPLTATDPDNCTNLVVALASEPQELEDAVADYLPEFSAVETSWALKAQPSLAIGNLAQLTIAQAPSASLEFDVEVLYPNPFSNHVVVASTGSISVRETKHPLSQLPATLIAGTEHVAEVPGQTCSDSTTKLDNPIGIPTHITLDDTPLLEDLQPIGFDRPIPARLAWEVAGPVDFYDVELVEVGTDSGQLSTTLTTVARYRTREPSLVISSSLLVADHIYYLVILPTLGVPGAATGDFTTKVFPLANAILPTASFVAQ